MPLSSADSEYCAPSEYDSGDSVRVAVWLTWYVYFQSLYSSSSVRPSPS